MHPHLLQPLGSVSVRAVRAAVAVAVIAALWMAFVTPTGAQTDEPTVVLCDESSGRLVELPESIAEGALHFPAHLATEAEIAAGECAVTAPDFGEGDGGSGEVALPVPTAVDPVSCGHFETQADAQAYFDSTELADPSVLDWDGDGIACEEAFDEDYNEPRVVDCGHFETREEAEEALERGNVAYPEDLDPDGDGIVCEDRWGEIETDFGEGNGENEDVPDSGQGAPAEVVALPETGTGNAGANDHAGRILAVMLMLVSGLAIGLQRRFAR